MSDSPACVHLHVHSEYSLGDGAIRNEELVDRVKSWGQSAVALTDHGNLFGAIEFYLAAKQAGVKAILGAEVYTPGHPATLEDAKQYGDRDPPVGAFHLVLLAQNLTGYQNLVRIVSGGHLDPTTPVPICRHEDLARCSDGLIVLSSCLHGEFGYLVQRLVRLEGESRAHEDPQTLEGRQTLARIERFVVDMKTRYPGRFYVELIDNNLPAQRAILPALVALARRFDLPIVASADAHYLDADMADSHAVLLAIRGEHKVADQRNRRRSARFHLLSPEEMHRIYGQWPDALANTVKIAEACDLKLEMGKYQLPNYPLPEGKSPESALREMAATMLEERFVALRLRYGSRFDAAQEQVYRQRLEYELSVITGMGFAGYFLIVQDFINWAKSQGIPVGPGRGSGAGSIVAYALRITDLDPIRLNLVFERFLNPERVSMPDFDVDFCQDRRDEVIRYVVQRYGKDRVAQITTFGKMQAKAVVRDVGRVLGMSYGRVDRIAKLIPNELGITLDDALEREPRLREEIAKDVLVQDLITHARRLEGLARHASVHAAGIVISDKPLVEHVPVYRTEESELITQYEMTHVEKVGLVKFDFLGLKTLTVIEKAVQMIRAAKAPDFSIDNIPLEDAKVYAQISTAFTTGIFQLESSGMQQLIAKLKPSKFEDIVALVALFRPGPLGSGMVDDFIERKHGRAPIHYPVPQLEPILRDTYGIFVYQEQVQKAASVLANYSLGEADLLRRAMGKKKPEEMAKQRSRFVAGAKSQSLSETQALEIFELMAKFAEYGFNKSHSAAYGLVSYQTAYLKTYYPEHFMAAIMTCDQDNTDKLERYVRECRRLGIRVLPPSIDESHLEFAVPAPQTVRFSLAAIKGVGVASLEALLEERSRGGRFESMTDLARRVDLSKVGRKTLELCVSAGAFDRWGFRRKDLMAAVGPWVRYSAERHVDQQRGQGMLFAECDAAVDDFSVDGLRAVKGGALLVEMSDLLAERKLLGAFVSGHPLDLYPEDMGVFGKTRLKDLGQFVGRGEVGFVAFCVDVYQRLSKKGHLVTYARLEDRVDSLEAMVAIDAREKREGTEEEVSRAGTPVFVTATVDAGFQPGSLRVKVTRLMSLEMMRQNRLRGITVQLDLRRSDGGVQDATLDELCGITQMHPGKVGLRLRMQIDRSLVTIEDLPLGVQPTDHVLSVLRGVARQLDGQLEYHVSS